MTVAETDKIDIFAFGKDGVLRLVITDHLPWGDEKHLMLLQEKLNAYLTFIESGQCYEDVPKARGAPVRIEVVTKYNPDDDARAFLFAAGEIAGRAGISLTHSMGT